MNGDKIKFDKKPRFKWTRGKVLIITAVMIFLLIAGAASAVLFLSYQNSSKSQQAESGNHEINTTTSQAVNNAQTLMNSGEKSAAVKVYDNAINTAGGSYQKSVLILSKATLYFNDGDYDTALSIAKEAETAAESDTVAYFIAQVYEKKADKANAVKYYQKALNLIDKTQPLADEDAQFYQWKISELEK